MALIKCPECGKKISNQCGKCPHCGYPIEIETDGNSLEAVEKASASAVAAPKPLYKRIWFGVVVGVLLIGIVVGVFLLLNRGTTPKYDKDGNPVFVELTNEVYTNADKYLGYHINIKGKVFQVVGDSGDAKCIQLWLDPESCEQNLMIYYTTEVALKQGDYVVCSGYIDSVAEYKNAYNATLNAPVVYSTDLEKATYIDVMAPTIDVITLEGIKRETLAYSVSVNKVEFSEKETRIYVTASNNGKDVLYVGDAVIVQDGKQYNATTNYDADYDEIPYEIVAGASCSGVVVFPPMSTNDFSLSFNVHSSNYNEDLGEYTFIIGKNASSVKEPEASEIIIEPENLSQEKYGYSVSIDTVEIHKDKTLVWLTACNSGKASLYLDVNEAIIVQDGKTYRKIDYSDHIYIEELQMPYETDQMVANSGFICFPAINATDFEFSIDVHSAASDEKLGEITVVLGKDKAEVKTPWSKDESKPIQKPSYPSPVGTYSYLGNNSIENILTIYSDGTLFVEYFDRYLGNGITIYCPLEGTWTQNGNDMVFTVWNTDGFMWNNPFCGTIHDDRIFFVGEYYEKTSTKTNSRKYYALAATLDYQEANKDKILSIYDFWDFLLVEKAYTDSEAAYAIENINTDRIYDGAAMYDYERIQMFFDQGYSREAIIDFYYPELEYWEAEYLVNECLAGRKLTYEWVDGEEILVEHE